jgi:hypothetical protein
VNAAVQRMKSLGVLTSTDGPFQSVIKIKPPMCFSRHDAARLAQTMDKALCELEMAEEATQFPTAAPFLQEAATPTQPAPFKNSVRARDYYLGF